VPGKRNVPAVVDEPLPWEKQKGESAKAFWGFEKYRDLGAIRSLTKVMEIAEETRVAGPSMIERWSSKWRWIDRVDAWDREQDRKQTAAADTARADAARLRTMTGHLAVGAALTRLRGDVNAKDVNGKARVVDRLDPGTMDAGEVARLMEAGNKMLASGLGESLDLKGSILVPGPRVQELAVNLLALAIDAIEATARAVAERPEEAEGILARTVDSTIERADGLFRSVTR
jgi:hypothetical protein